MITGFSKQIGFESIINKNLDQAISAFEKSENSYNNFHQVHEIGRFLRTKRESRNEQKEDFWQEIYKKVLSDYNWKMPKDIKIQLEELIK